MGTEDQDRFNDLASDPLQLDNLIDTSHLEINRLRGMLLAVRRKSPQVRPGNSGESNPEAHLEELKALGYVQ